MSTLDPPPPNDPARSVMENTLELRDLSSIRPVGRAVTIELRNVQAKIS